MKSWWIAAVALAVSSSLVSVADAKRLGGGKSQGMQRSAPAQATPQTPAKPAQAAPQQTSAQPATPATAAAPATAGAAAAAAAPAKRSWLGPIAGLAAGLGLAALMSHLGLGEAFANFLMLALLAVGAALLVAFLLRRFGRSSAGQAAGGPALSTAGASAGAGAGSAPPGIEPSRVEPVMQRAPLQGADVSVTGQPLRPLGVSEASMPASAEVAAAQPEAVAGVAPAAPAASGPQLPEGFDLPAFERVAKLIFIRLQAANDKADLDDLRQFTTPELFAAIRLDLQERHGTAQHTDVERVDARVVDYALEQGRQIVSVRFQGLVREQAGAAAEAFDEVWHLVKPEGDGGNWAIAGIQQPQ